MRTSTKHRSRTSAGSDATSGWNNGGGDRDSDADNNADSINIIEGATRTKVSRSSAADTVGLSAGIRSSAAVTVLLLAVASGALL